MCSLCLSLRKSQEVFPIIILCHRLSLLNKLLLCNPSLLVGYLLQTSHLESLPFLDDLNECACFGKAVVCSGVKSGESALQSLHLQLLLLKVFLVDACYLQLTPCTGLDILCNIHDTVGIEI